MNGTIAMVVSTVGYHWQEAFDPYHAFKAAGFEVPVFTVDGKQPLPDPYSLKLTGPLSLLGLGMPRSIAPVSERGKALLAAMHDARSIDHLHPSSTDALYLPGGHGCLFDVNRNEALHMVIARLYEHGAILSAVCHATSTFAYVKVNGRSIVDGHALTGFPNPLDQTLLKAGAVHERFRPLPLVNDDVLRQHGARLSKRDVLLATLNPRFVRTSLPFITGVGPKAAARVARQVVGALERRRQGTVSAVAMPRRAEAMP